MIKKERVTLEAPEDNPQLIIPIEYEGVKTMSYGYAAQNNKAVLRGLMATQMTDWGELDYLIIDMPPGTGDIGISLGQEVSYSGSVIITTPQKLSYIDVVKGIEMFDDLKVPTISVVENMAYFSMPDNSKNYIFGPSSVDRIQNLYGIKNSFTIPIDPDVSKYSDIGSPLVLTLPETNEISKTFREIAFNLDKECDNLERSGNLIPHVRYDTSSSQVIVRTPHGVEKKISARELRLKCKSALMVDELSGVRLFQESDIPQDVFPYKIEPKGNYAVAIAWSDGHRASIYPYEYMLSDEIKGEIIELEKIAKGGCQSEV